MTNWKKKALAATAGSQFGAILAAATDTKIKAPCFTSKAVITSDGFVTANLVGADGRAHLGAFVGHVRDLIRNTNGLADHLALEGADRAELFSVVLLDRCRLQRCGCPDGQQACQGAWAPPQGGVTMDWKRKILDDRERHPPVTP